MRRYTVTTINKRSGEPHHVTYTGEDAFNIARMGFDSVDTTTHHVALFADDSTVVDVSDKAATAHLLRAFEA